MLKLKTTPCAICKQPVAVQDDYEPELCCNGEMCACYGEIINPVYCERCFESLTYVQRW